MDDVEDVYNNKKTRILLASVRITDKKNVTKLNDKFALTREFYYGKILYADKQKFTIRVIRDLNKTNTSIIHKQIIFLADRINVEVLQVDQIPIAEVVDYIGYVDLVKVPHNNYERAQEFVKIVGNRVKFKTDKGTFDTANIMDTLVVHGETKYLFSASSFLFQWWETNKKDILKKITAEKERKAENAKKKEEERLAALAVERAKRREEEASKRRFERLAELAEQKEAEAAAEQKQREAEEAKRKAEEAKEKREKKKKERKQQREEFRKNPRKSGRKPKKRKPGLHEEYKEKLKF